MARVRVKNTKKVLQSVVKEFKGKLKQNISRAKKDAVIDVINSTILSGQSPVKGKQFKQYTKKYADREKDGSRKPVNMYLSGGMLDSLEVKQERGRPGLVIRFKSALAFIHDQEGPGGNKDKIRRLLPRFSKGESFKAHIQKIIDDLLKKVVIKSTK